MLKEDYKGKEKDVIISIHHVKSKIVQCADAIIFIHHVKSKTVQYTDVIISIHHGLFLNPPVSLLWSFQFDRR